MNWNRFLLCLGLGLLLAGCQDPGLLLPTGPISYRPASSAKWSPDPPNDKGTFWLKTTVRIPEDFPEDMPLGFLASMLASTELYWDQERIGQNGRVGQGPESEIAGQMARQFLIPARLCRPGVHHIEIRFSNYHGNGQFRIYALLAGDYWFMARDQLITSNFIHIYAGFFLIIGLYFLVRFALHYHQLTNLLFGLISLAFFALILFEYIRVYYYYPYPWHFTRLEIIMGLTFVISFLLPVFFGIQFGFSRRQMASIVALLLLALCAGIIFILPLGYDPATMNVMLIGFVFSLYIIITAFSNGAKGSALALTGIVPIPVSAWYWYNYYDYIIFAGFGHLTLMTLVALAVQEREERKIRQESMLLSARLEKELLKKNIQPHFLMNSLTSAIDWIEEEPEKGVELLYSLVDEFDILLRISDQKLIRVEEEIALCRAHLEIMSFRKEQQFILHPRGIDYNEQIPPAVIHTILENGITHNRLERDTINFYLTFSRTGPQRHYHIFCENDLSNLDFHPGTAMGTGLQYVRARLEESFPGQWDFEHRPADGGWETHIFFG